MQRLTHPQQSTAEAISRLVSPPKRQAMQGKSLSCRRYTLELLPTCENIGLQSHLGPRNSQAHSSAPQETPSHTPDAPPATPQTLPQTRPLRTTLPPHPSRTPDVHLPPQIRMQFPNRSDSVTQRDTNKQGVQRELHAKLQHLRPLAGPVATPPGGHRAQAATHPDR